MRLHLHFLVALAEERLCRVGAGISVIIIILLLLFLLVLDGKPGLDGVWDIDISLCDVLASKWLIKMVKGMLVEVRISSFSFVFQEAPICVGRKQNNKIETDDPSCYKWQAKDWIVSSCSNCPFFYDKDA